jgi:hypothetical protein
MDDGDHNDQFGYYKVAVAVFSALLVAAIGQGIIVWRDNSVLSVGLEDLQRAVDANTATIRVIAEQAYANSIHRVEHEKQADRWIAKILENERSIHSLQQQPSARPDPFTGTEGRELERRIRAIERGTGDK